MRRRRFAYVTLTVAAATLGGAGVVVPQAAAEPVRHQRPRAGEEFLVLRHQRLVKGSHDRFHELSRNAVWPFYEKLGARIVGQWKVVHPGGRELGEDFDEGYRLARYRSFNHWAATRDGAALGGNGADFDASRGAIEERNRLRLGSDGPIYLQGATTRGGPYYFPPTGERWQVDPEGDGAQGRPVRHGAAVRGGPELLTLRYFRIRKGTFREFHRLSEEEIWPFFEKMGARVVGQWLVVYPQPGELEAWSGSDELPRANPGYDEAYMLVRYASYEHWQATRPDVMHRLGGDGEDWRQCRDGLEHRLRLTLASTLTYLEGQVYDSPPVYLPVLDETYRPSPAR